MKTHINGDCPAMEPGDGMADTGNFAIEEWAYDCMICRYTEKRIHRAWEGGFLNALQLALYRLEEIQTARELGRSKLQIFRLLVDDWRDRETVWSPEFLPLMIMTDEEIMAYSCPDCERGMSYSRTENDVAVWACDVCGREMRMMTGSEGF